MKYFKKYRILILLGFFSSCVPIKKFKQKEAEVSKLKQELRLTEEQLNQLDTLFQERNDQYFDLSDRFRQAENQWNFKLDSTANHYIDLNNKHMRLINDEFAVISDENIISQVNILSNQLKVTFKKYIENDIINVSKTENSVVVAIVMDSIFDNKTFLLNTKGQYILSELNSNLISESIDKSFYVEGSNKSKIVFQGGIQELNAPSPFLNEFLDSINAFRVRNKLNYSTLNFPSFDSETNYIGDTFYIIFKKAIPELKTYLIDDYYENGRLLNVQYNYVNSYEKLESYRYNEPIKLMYLPEKTTKYLIIPSAYRLAGFKSLSASLNVEHKNIILEKLRNLIETNKIKYTFKGNISKKKVLCSRPYGLIVLDSLNDFLYKDDNFILQCQEEIIINE